MCCDLSAVHTVDRWRVVLKGETPDYINATVVHVSLFQDPLSLPLTMAVVL